MKEEIEGYGKLRFFFRHELDLIPFTKTDECKKFRLPSSVPQIMSSSEFLEFYESRENQIRLQNKNNQCILTKTGTQIQSIEDFEFIKMLGQGAYGTVVLSLRKVNKKPYAIKIIEKNKIIKSNILTKIVQEKQILNKVNNPFLVKLDFCFHSHTRIFMVMKYLDGGDLRQILNLKGKFDEKTAKFYAAQVVLGLEGLHKENIIWRDMKPDNIVFNKKGYIKLIDFGCSKVLDEHTTKLDDIEGTPSYFSPEMLKMTGYDISTDYWSFGILLYELLFDTTPFYDEVDGWKGYGCKMYKNITEGDFTFPKDIPITESCKDLITSF